jgi:peptidoglycan/xylan/chitin deacetylase (PgdA/CDA1 family)
MYHRVGSPICDPERLAVTPENLKQQIEVLKEKRTVVPLAWLADRLARGLPVEGTAVVTFDDGYADTFHQGLPILSALDCPATVFLATGFIGTGSNMWWDILARLFFLPGVLPPQVRIDTLHRPIAIDGTSAKSRTLTYRRISDLVRRLPSPERDAIVCDLARQIRGNLEDMESDRLMTPDEVIRWRSKGMFDVGAHTVTHPSLPALPDRYKASEIEDSCRTCADLIGDAPAGFAYPYGNYDASTISSVIAARVDMAVTTEKRTVSRNESPFKLPRYYVGNWNGEEFAKTIRF